MMVIRWHCDSVEHVTLIDNVSHVTHMYMMGMVIFTFHFEMSAAEDRDIGGEWAI